MCVCSREGPVAPIRFLLRRVVRSVTGLSRDSAWPIPAELTYRRGRPVCMWETRRNGLPAL
jgi:hypothetical protein